MSYSTHLIGVRGPYLRRRQRLRKTGTYPQTEYYFQATWQETTSTGWKKRKATFSIQAHGYEEALSRAITARLEAEAKREK